MNPYLQFESFEAACSTAPALVVDQGYITFQGRRCFSRCLKSRRNVRAFVDHSYPMAFALVVLSMRGNYLCMAEETDAMGLTILKPDFRFPIDHLKPL